MKQLIVAMRGRGGEETDQFPAQRWHQQLEVNYEGICNAITTISKDNLVLEITEDNSNK